VKQKWKVKKSKCAFAYTAMLISRLLSM